MRIWHMLRQHGAPVDNMTGATMAIRHEALVAEIARHAEPEELLWRLRLLDAQFVDLKNAERHKKEERTTGHAPKSGRGAGASRAPAGDARQRIPTAPHGAATPCRVSALRS